MHETILQFGAGNFLRAFADLFIAQSNRTPSTALGKIVVVQSTGRERAEALNAAGGNYHVVLQGFANGQVVDQVEKVDSISRAIYAGTDWPEVLRVATSPALQWILSNTTEAGFALDARDASRPSGQAPYSFPAKLLDVLLTRQQAGLGGLSIVPCELIEANGRKLKELVRQQAILWKTESTTLDWLETECRWIDNLVDRIVPGVPENHPLQASDPLLLAAEPFAFWGVQASGGFLQHPAVTLTHDLAPFYLRKVRILNGAHSALVSHALPLGLQTVRECVEHPQVGPWLARVLFEEIVPVLEGRVEGAEDFARTTLDRFRNPFLKHQLSAIALNHEAKVAVRLKPTLEDFQNKFGRKPPLLAAALGL